MKAHSVRRIPFVLGFLALLGMLLAHPAFAHPGHEHGSRSDGRLPGQPDFKKIGKTTYRFNENLEEYEVREPGEPTAYAHFDSAKFETAEAGPNTPLPANEDDPICRTSGPRVVVVYTHRSSDSTPTPTESLRSIMRRMNWKLLDQSMQASGNSRGLQIPVHCSSGSIQVYDVTTANNDFSTIKSTVPAALFGTFEPVKYLVFDHGGSGGGIATRYKDVEKTFTNDNNGSGVALAFKDVWDTHVPMHELFHTFGASQGDAVEPPPFSSEKSHCTDGLDILCYDDDSEGTIYTTTRCPEKAGYDQPAKTPIDCGTDTYFDAIPAEGSWLDENWNSGGEENLFLVNEGDTLLKARTDSVTALGTEEAVLTGLIYAGGSLQTKYRFEYGKTTSYGSSAPASFTNVEAGPAGKAVQQTIKDLDPGQTYHYRIAVSNSNGTVHGQDRTFRTSLWRPRSMPSLEKTALLHDVSCSGKGACTTVGEHRTTPPWAAIAMRWDGGEWETQSLPNPGAGDAVLEGVSCPTTTACVAVGKRGNSPLAEHWDGSEWAIVSVPSPGDAKGSVELHDVACTAASSCMAVGEYQYIAESSSTKTLTAKWDGEEWKVVSSPHPEGATSSELNGVSCTSASACTAVGGSAGEKGAATLAIRWNGESWSTQLSPAHAFGSTGLNDVSCPTATACMAVGWLNGKFAALEWDGSAWQQTKSISDLGTPGRGVSCTAADACFTVFDRHVYLEGGVAAGHVSGMEWDGTEWIFDSLVEVTTESTQRADSVSCWGASSCVAAGFHFDVAANKSKPMVQQRSLAKPPSVTAKEAVGLELSGATLRAVINPRGAETSYQFEYGQTTSYGSKAPIPAGTISSGGTAVEVEEDVEGLKPNAVYHFRVVATNEEGTTYGSDLKFTTLPAQIIGSKGTGNGQFDAPSGIAADAEGNLWVADTNNNRIQKFNSKGEYLSQFGSKGSGNGQLSGPMGVAIGPDGNVWVADTNNNRIQKFNSKGEYLTKYGSLGSGTGQFNGPQGIVVDPIGNAWVTDTGNNRVQRVSTGGGFLTFGSKGSGDQQLDFPTGIGVDPNGTTVEGFFYGPVWVADTNNNRIQKLWISSPGISSVGRFGSSGSGNGQFDNPRGVAFDSESLAWVADRNNHRVQRFIQPSNYLEQIGSKGSGSSQFESPIGVAPDLDGNVWVADTGNNRILKWFKPLREPSATTDPATKISQTGATLNAWVSPNRSETTYQFEYGKTTSYGSKAPVSPKSIGSGSYALDQEEAIGGLQAGTTYHFRVAASNANGTVYGQDKTFTTEFSGADNVAVWYKNGNGFYLRKWDEENPLHTYVLYGSSGSPALDLPVMGDWNGDGIDTVGVWRREGEWSTYRLRNSNTEGAPDVIAAWGRDDSPDFDLPVVGDWDGDGDDTVGIWRRAGEWATFHLRNSNTGGGGADHYVTWGGDEAPYNDLPVVGDWDGDGDDTVGVWRRSNNTFYLRNSHAEKCEGSCVIAAQFGNSEAPYNDLPVVGDWDGDGDDTIGVWRREGNWAHFRLRNSNTAGAPDQIVYWGGSESGYANDLPLIGNWGAG